MRLCEIGLRDPFIYADRDRGVYYLYGSERNRNEQTRFRVYSSYDLEEWDGGKEIFAAHEGFWGRTHFWAPELHKIDGRYYIFATFMGDNNYNRCQLLVCDRPDGRFIPYGEPITPERWAALDGTLFSSGGKKYCVFCREWRDVGNGEICLTRLDGKLKPIGKVKTLFKARDEDKVINASDSCECYVTDGPFLIRHGDTLFMLWSSFTENGYTLLYAAARGVEGPWEQRGVLLDSDCGHGMIFRDFENNARLVCHTPNSVSEHPEIYRVKIFENSIGIDK